MPKPPKSNGGDCCQFGGVVAAARTPRHPLDSDGSTFLPWDSPSLVPWRPLPNHSPAGGRGVSRWRMSQAGCVLAV
jgi:hypothetical protein